MSDIEAALDLGSSFISSACTKTGFIVKEPSVVALGPGGKTAAGIAAAKLAKSSGAKLVSPIVEGAVTDKDKAQALIKTVLGKVLPRNTFFSRTVVMCAVPCAMGKTEKQKIEYVLDTLSVKKVRFIEAPLAASAQIFNEFNADKGVICDMGSDKTDVAVISGGEILSGCTLYHSGRQIDREIAGFVDSKYNVRISEEEAEKVKRAAGSLYQNDLSAAEAQGTNTFKGVAETIEITARELYDLLAGIIGKYAQIIDSLLASLPPEIAPAVKNQGVFLCGGLSNLSGIDKFLLEALKINVRIPSSPDTVCIKGALKMFKHGFASATRK